MSSCPWTHHKDPRPGSNQELLIQGSQHTNRWAIIPPQMNVAHSITWQCTFCTLQIIIWDPQHLRSLQTLPTLGGFAYSLAISPLDPGTLGVGVGDNMLRVWQTASSVGPYEALTLWQGIKSKVMVVSNSKGHCWIFWDGFWDAQKHLQL